MSRSNDKHPKRQYPRFSVNAEVQQFYEQHYGDEGPITIGSRTYFADGAIVETSEYGQLLPPPDDAWQRSKNIETYWTGIVERAIAAFDGFSNYLLGYGSAPSHVAYASKEVQLDYLESLRAKAQAAKRKLRRAKQQVADDQPAWLTAKLREEARGEQREAEFKSKVASFRL